MGRWRRHLSRRAAAAPAELSLVHLHHTPTSLSGRGQLPTKSECRSRGHRELRQPALTAVVAGALNEGWQGREVTTQPRPDESPIAWVALTVDCPNASTQERMRDFYARALGGEIVAGSVRARGWLLIFDVVPDYRRPTWPSAETPKQIHFEWMVEDLDHAVSMLQDLGATEADHQNPNDPELRVMLDPAGHPFCLMTTRSVMPAFADEGARQQR